MRHVLVVEDDSDVAVPLASFFHARGFDAAIAATGQEALDHVASIRTDLVLLDLILPDLDGMEVCGGLRNSGFTGGIIMLSGRDQEMNVVTGLDAGADDYLAKPCSVAELEARVGSVLRRISRAYAVPAGGLLDVGTADVHAGLEVRDHRITCGGVEVVSGGREYDVLAQLIAHRGRTVATGDLMDRVWEPDWTGSPVVLSSAVGRIRKRLAAAGARERVEAVRGVGFRLTHPGGP